MRVLSAISFFSECVYFPGLALSCAAIAIKSHSPVFHVEKQGKLVTNACSSDYMSLAAACWEVHRPNVDFEKLCP